MDKLTVCQQASKRIFVTQKINFSWYDMIADIFFETEWMAIDGYDCSLS